jgi:hypothetical protein
VVISSAERTTSADRPAGNPFLVGDMLLYPNLGEPVRKQDTQEVGFFLTVYPGKKDADVKATLELVQNGRLLAQSPLTLGERDPFGRVQQVSRLPIAELPPGNYDLRIVVSQGDQRLLRSTTVRIVG